MIEIENLLCLFAYFDIHFENAYYYFLMSNLKIYIDSGKHKYEQICNGN